MTIHLQSQIPAKFNDPCREMLKLMGFMEKKCAKGRNEDQIIFTSGLLALETHLMLPRPYLKPLKTSKNVPSMSDSEKSIRGLFITGSNSGQNI